MEIHCFYQTEPLKKMYNRLHTLFSTGVEVIEGGLDRAYDYYEGEENPDLMILQTSESYDEVLEGLEKLASLCNETTKVIIIHHEDDIKLFEALNNMGVSDFIVGVPDPVDIYSRILELYTPPSSSDTFRSCGVAFLSARGGAGSSIQAHLFALMSSLAIEKKVLLVDFDMAFGTVARSFKVDNVTSGTAEVLLSSHELNETILQTLVTEVNPKLDILASPRDLSQSYDIPEDMIPPTLRSLYSNYPLVIFDLPMQWCPWQQTVLSMSDHIVLVSEPVRNDLHESKKLYEFLKSSCPDKVIYHNVINKVGQPKRKELSAKELDSLTEGKVTTTLPYNPGAFQSKNSDNEDVFSILKQAKINKAMAELCMAVHKEDFSAIKDVTGKQIVKSADLVEEPDKPKAAKAASGSLKDKLLNMIFEPT